MYGRMNKTAAQLLMVAAWIAVVAIAYATLTRVGFVYSIYFKLAPFLMRPDMRLYAHVVHVVAFTALGAIFGLAYPRRPVLVCCTVLGAAVGLEILQTLTQDRHGTIVDALEKLAGGAAGIALAKISLRVAALREKKLNSCS
jgi:hypothetical protein